MSDRARRRPSGLQCVAELALRHTRKFLLLSRQTLFAAIALGATLSLTPQTASAEGFFDFLFGGAPAQKQQPRRGADTNFFADPFGLNTPAAPSPRPVASSGGGSGPSFCVRSCDGKYFPLGRGMSPAQMCQAFCPASPTKVFFGSNIDGAATSAGERYPDSENAYAYRKALRADCTCNGRDPAGLAPVDLTLDSSLRPGDVIATSSGLVAYSGVRTGNSQTAEFTPVASYPGLTSDVRARLGEMKVAPVAADMVAEEAPMPDTAAPAAAVTVAPKRAPNAAKPAATGKRAEIE
ncbi:MAG: hypothetical protein JWQ94_1150 [Tardiphaga sp.]|nr:hypothetical protein [Tardiphaga sp.]